MPTAKKQTAAPARKRPARAAAVNKPAATEEEPAGSEEVMVVLPAADEPVRCGGHILTEDGWVLEDAPVTEEAELEQPADDESGQE